MPKRRPRTDLHKELAIEEFGNKAEADKINSLSLNDLSLSELIRHYNEIDRQSHILKGKIILNARSRFTLDREFGLWLTENLPDLTQKQAHRLMSIAEFFNEHTQRSMEGIGLSVCYELSAPQHKDIAEKIYQEIAGKNYPLAVVRDKLYKNNPININSKTEKPTKTEIINTLNTDFKPLIHIIVNELLMTTSTTDSIAILQECIKYIKHNRSNLP